MNAVASGGAIVYEFAKRVDLNEVSTLLKACELPDNDLEKHKFIVAKNDGLIVGCIGLEIPGPLLRSMAVRPDFRNRGIAGELCKRLLKFAKKQHAGEIYLLTDSAEKFFEKNGWDKVDRETAPEWVRAHKQFTTLCPVSAVVMHKSL